MIQRVKDSHPADKTAGNASLDPAKLSPEKLYREYAAMVYRFVYSKCRNPDLAEEIVQETFVQAVDSISRFEGGCKVSTWLCSIARNQLNAWYKKHPYTADLEKQLAAQHQNQEDVEYLRLLHRLPDPYREVMYLRLFGSLSYRQIGDIFEKSENWARVTFFRGREKLREEMKK